MGADTPRTVLVTGASYGLGASVADAARRHGDTVWTLSRTPPRPLHLGQGRPL